jgi:hypothetical protein
MTGVRAGRIASLASACLLLGCATGHGSVAPKTPTIPPVLSAPLGVVEIAERIPLRVKERRAWSEAILAALVANELTADGESVCAVIAVIGQESGFAADPAVPGMAALVAKRMERYQARLGPLGEPLFTWLLAGHAPDNPRTFKQRLATVRSERDVDRVFRDLLGYYDANHPAIYAALNLAGKLASVNSLAELNPITTVGSMQVSVRFAEDWARSRNHEVARQDRPAAHPESASTNLREELYTIRGGVYYGTARLLSYPVHYGASIFRFADYNAGIYASRNAAVQAQLSRLTGTALALDGDLLSYEKDGSAKDEESESLRAVRAFAEQFAPRLSSPQIRRDLLSEKTLAFEDTDTYRAIQAAFVSRFGAPAEYAILPRVSIVSPKFSGSRSTAWFAQAVERRYRTCLGAHTVTPPAPLSR